MSNEAGRQRNRRGEGSRLRDEIVAAAAESVDEAGTTQEITLRAIARRVGVTAPAIYSHFDGPDAIIEALVDATFEDFNNTLAAAAARARTPVTRVRAICSAYLDFAERQPHRYRLLFLRQTGGPEPLPPRELDDPRLGGFKQLVDGVEQCVDAGLSGVRNQQAAATAIWLGLHGYATLHSSFPRFPWPSSATLVTTLVKDHLHLED